MLLLGVYLSDIEKKPKEYNDKMKNGDEKWNLVTYDYNHRRFAYGRASGWWLLDL